MTSPGGGYLPPVIATITGDSAELVRVLEEAKSMLADFARQSPMARLGADTRDLFAVIDAAKVDLADFARRVADAKLGADAAPFWRDIAALKAELAALNPLDLDVDADTKLALEKIAALKTALAGVRTEHLIGEGLGLAGAGVADAVRGGERSLANGSLGALFGAGGAGVASSLLWGETGGGFLSRLMSPISMLSTMFSAGFGSVGSFAGFGPEHLAMTLGGLAGFGGEGLIGGGGALALGALGKTMVGGGADMLANRSAMSGVKGYQALAQAVAVYGKNSVQAQAAAGELAFAMRGDSKAALAAESGIQKAASALKVQWHAASSAAQVESTRIMSQVLHLASSYAGRVASAAKQNLSIINTGLKPLFAWLEGPGGSGVFAHLEAMFKSTLPTAIHAFDQGIELLLRTMSVASSYTGGFVKHLDAFLTRTNSPTGFAKWSADIGRLIGDFRTLEAFFKALGHDLHSLFKNDAGTPEAIIKGLTHALQELGKWEDSAAGKASLFSVFSAHKNQIMQLGKAIGDLGLGFGRVYLKAAPAMVTAVTDVLKVINPLITVLSKNQFTSFLLGLSLIALRFKFVRAALVKWVAAQVASAAETIALWAMYTAERIAQYVAQAAAATAAFIAENAATLGIVALIALLVAAVVELATHWHQVWTDIKSWSKDAWHFLENVFHNQIVQDILAVYTLGLLPLAEHWKTVWNDIKNVAKTAWNSLKSIFTDGIDWVKSHWKLLAEILVAIFVPGGIVLAAVARFHTQIVAFFKRIYTDVTDWVKRLWHDVVTAFDDLKRDVLQVFDDAGTWLVSAGEDIVHGLVNGIENAVGSAVSAAAHVGKSVLGAVGGFLGIHSPSTVMRDQIGVPISQGIAVGITKGLPEVHKSLANLSSLAATPWAVSLPGSAASANNAQLARIEALLTQILSESKQTSTGVKQTANNTKDTVTATRGLSSPAGVAAQIQQSHGRLVTAIHAGSSRG